MVGEPVRLVLGNVAATGYDWQLEPTSAVRLLDGPLQDDPLRAPGDAVEQSLLVVPLAPGQLVLRLRLVRPWEPDQPIRTMTRVLDVHLPA